MHRVLLELGAIKIYSYGFMMAMAFIAGTYLARERAKRRGIDPAKIVDLVFLIMASSILGARIFYVIMNFDYYKSNILDAFKIWEGGLVFYGGFILALILSAWFLKKNKLPFYKIVDIFSPSLAIGIAIGRMGCYLNGCCYGKISREFGVCFPAAGNPPVFAQQVMDNLLSPSARYSLPVIPTQIFDSLSAILIFVILLVLEKRKRPDGFIFWIFVLLYSISRFFIEAFRYYDSNFILFGLITVSQLISILLALTSVVFLLRIKKLIK
jgi:phosphatidylglycerol:prolipoprotein diacylglycerol transferase